MKKQRVCSGLELFNMKHVLSFPWTRDLGQNYVGHKQTLFQLILSQSLEGGNSHSETYFFSHAFAWKRDKEMKWQGMLGEGIKCLALCACATV